MADQLFDAKAPEPLFPHLEGEADTFPVSDFGIQQLCGRIDAIDHESARLDRQEDDLIAWFNGRRERLKGQRERHEEQIVLTLKELGEKSCATPYGTAYIRKSSVTNWPADAEIVAWAKASGVDATLLRTKESPDKKAIKEYMMKTGEIVPGYSVSEVEAISIRKAS